MIIVSPILRIIGIVATYIIYLVTILSCFGGMVPPSLTPWGSVLSIGMPFMVTISAAITILWFCFGHWIVGSAGVLTFIICISPIRMWFPMNGEKKPEREASTFTILTWNILHDRDLEDPGHVGSRTFSKILEIDADVVCLQEIQGFTPKNLHHYDQAILDSLFKKYPYVLGEDTYDLRILSKYPLRHIYFGSVNKYNLAEYFTVKFPEREIAMADIHLPSFALDENEKHIFTMGDRDEKAPSKENLSKAIVRKLKHAIPVRADAAKKINNGFQGLSMPVIICGDFNDVPASWTYRLFLKSGFKDAYVETNFFPTYTFYPNHLYFHLDQIFYRGSVKPLSVKRINIHTSDHLPLLATFEFLPDPY